MVRRRNKSGGDSFGTMLLLAGGAYLVYEWWKSNYSTTITIGSPTSPITVAAPPATLISSGPLSNAPQGPTDANGAIPIIGNSGSPLGSDASSAAGVAGYFNSTGMW